MFFYWNFAFFLLEPSPRNSSANPDEKNAGPPESSESLVYKY